jgi:hypothetical protein
MVLQRHVPYAGSNAFAPTVVPFWPSSMLALRPRAPARRKTEVDCYVTRWRPGEASTEPGPVEACGSLRQASFSCKPELVCSFWWGSQSAGVTRLGQSLRGLRPAPPISLEIVLATSMKAYQYLSKFKLKRVSAQDIGLQGSY